MIILYFFALPRPATAHLKLQLGEEPLVLTGLVSLFECLLDGLLGIGSLRRLLESVSSDGSLQRFEFQRVSSGHEVVVVDGLDKRLDLGSSGNLLSGMLLGNLQRVSLDTSNNGMTKGVGLGTVVVGLDDNNLLTGESTSGDDG